jgi:regulator of protease activity HflC (stomatin/prohibitin superfamily)
MKNKKGTLSPVFYITAGIVFLIAMLTLFLGFDKVEATNAGVMVQMGTVKGYMGPGFNWTGILTDVYQYDMRTRKMVLKLQGTDGSASDNTGQAIYANININYKIKKDSESVIALYKYVGLDNEIVDKLNIEARVREAFKQSAVKFEAMETLPKRDELKEMAKNNIAKNFPAQYFEIEDIMITDIDFSPDFRKQLELKKLAIQEGLTEENKIKVVQNQQAQEVAIAEATKQKRILAAEASAKEVTLAAEAEAARVLATKTAEAKGINLVAEAEANRLRLQRQEINDATNTRDWISKWSGNLPDYIMTTPENADILMQLPAVQTQ